MELSKQCCSIEQAKRLKELGISGRPMFCYWTQMNNLLCLMKWTYVEVVEKWCAGLQSVTSKEFTVFTIEDHWVPSFTVAELGLALRAYSGIGHSFYNEHTHRGKGGWGHTHTIWGKGIQPILDYYDSEAEARAAMLIHLLENDLTTPEEVNKRLSE